MLNVFKNSTNLKDISYAYANIKNIKGDFTVPNDNITNATNCFYGRNNSSQLNIIANFGTDSHNAFLVGMTNAGNGQIYSYNDTANVVMFNTLTTNMADAFKNDNTITKAACGSNVTDMTNAYQNCYSLTGNPVCGSNVTSISRTYYNCNNLTGNPVCGPNVTNMNTAYIRCYNLKGQPVCGDKVTDMGSAYTNCHNLVGIPVCGPNVTSMYYTYGYCYNLTGQPVCGQNVTYMPYAYANCRNLTGNPVCGDNVTNMTCTYRDCHKLTGDPVCGDKVTTMWGAYYNCPNLTGQPVCKDNVTDMTNAYYNCTGLTGSPVCGNNVTTMNYTYYNCTNLTGNPVCGPSVTTMNNTYYNCPNLYGDMYVLNDSVFNVANCFKGRNNSKRLNIFVNKNTTSYNTLVTTNSFSIVGSSITWTSNASCMYNTGYNIYIYNMGDTPESNDGFYYTVTSIHNSSNNGYGYVYNNTSYYYESDPDMYDQDESYALCNVVFNNPDRINFKIDLIQDCEYTYDYTYVSTLNNSFPISIEEPSTNVAINAYDISDNVYSYSNAVNGYFHVKYIKDSSLYEGSDQVKFRLVDDNYTPLPHTYYNGGAEAIKPKIVTYQLRSSTVRYPNSITPNNYTLVQEANNTISLFSNSSSDTITKLSFNNSNFIIGISNIGDCVTGISNLCYNCVNLKGTPACGNKVTNMSNAYYNCKNLTDAPVSGPRVTDMSHAYELCTNITGTAACGPNVTNMSAAYESCFNLKTAVCGPKVTDMYYAYYGCSNLTGNAACGNKVTNMAMTYGYCNKLTGAVCGSNVTNMYWAYSYCNNISGNMYVNSNNVSNATGCFIGRDNSKRLNIFINSNTVSYNTFIKNNAASITAESIAWYASSNYVYNSTANIYIYGLGSGSSTQSNFYYTVANNSGSNYGFFYNDASGYYESDPDVGNSEAAGCKITFENPDRESFYVNIYQSSEADYDYAYISNCNSATWLYNTKNQNGYATFAMSDNQSGYFYIEYQKDIVDSEGEDLVRFRLTDINGNPLPHTYYTGTNTGGNTGGNTSTTNLFVISYNTTDGVFHFPATFKVGSVSASYDSHYTYTTSNSGYTTHIQLLSNQSGKSVTQIDFAGFNPINGVSAIGDCVINMFNTFYNCRNLVSSPVCGNNVTDMSNAYYYCINLTGSPVCGHKVTNMSRTYQECRDLTGNPVCGSNVTNMYSTYSNCYNISGNAVCGNKVTNMVYAYRGCNKITSGVIGSKVTNAAYAYMNCTNLKGDFYIHTNTLSCATGVFNNKGSGRINVFIKGDTGSTTYETLTKTSVADSITGTAITWANTGSTYTYNTQQNIYIYYNRSF